MNHPRLFVHASSSGTPASIPRRHLFAERVAVKNHSSPVTFGSPMPTCTTKHGVLIIAAHHVRHKLGPATSSRTRHYCSSRKSSEEQCFRMFGKKTWKAWLIFTPPTVWTIYVVAHDRRQRRYLKLSYPIWTIKPRTNCTPKHFRGWRSQKALDVHVHIRRE